MNYQLVIKRTLQLQAKIVKACGRNFGSLKSFNSKYVLSNIDYDNKTVTFQTKNIEDVHFIFFNFNLVRGTGKKISHSIVAELIK